MKKKKEVQKFMKSSTLFIIVFSLVMVMLNLAYINWVLYEKDVYKKEFDYDTVFKNSGNKTIEYSFFGDSHTYSDVNPEYISDSSFNFGIPGENYAETYYKMMKIIYKDGVSLRYVLLEIDPHTFSSYLTNKSYVYRSPSFSAASYSDISAITGKKLIDVFIKYNIPVVGNGADFIILAYSKLSKSIQADFNRFGYRNAVKSGEVNLTQNALIRYNGLFLHQDMMDSVSMYYFGRVLDAAKENNLTVIFVKYPLSTEFLETLSAHNITQNKYYDGIFEIINGRLDSYHVLDYQDYLVGNSSYFYDSDHLNEIGAELISKKIAMDMKNLSNFNNNAINSR